MSHRMHVPFGNALTLNESLFLYKALWGFLGKAVKVKARSPAQSLETSEWSTSDSEDNYDTVTFGEPNRLEFYMPDNSARDSLRV